VLPGWPTPATAGTHVTAYDAAHTLTNNGTACVTAAGGGCPAGIGWNSIRGFVTTTCGTIDGYTFQGLLVRTHNAAQHGDFSTPCTIIKNSLITGQFAIGANTGVCLLNQNGLSAAQNICGPVTVSDTSIIVPNSPVSGSVEQFGNYNWQCIRCVGVYGRTMFNCQGWCDLEESFAIAGYYDAAGTCAVSCAHLGSVADTGATSTDASTIAPFFTINHNTIECRTTNLDVGVPNSGTGGCTGDLNYVVHTAQEPGGITPMVLKATANLLVETADGTAGNCQTTWGDGTLVFSHIEVTNNVFETRVEGCYTNGGGAMGTGAPNKWCNNLTETGVNIGSPPTGSDFNCP
jgi:hypothetical protein